MEYVCKEGSHQPLWYLDPKGYALKIGYFFTLAESKLIES
jgi:hypothetical protein